MSVIRFAWAVTLASTALGASHGLAEMSAQRPMNIVLVLVDDLGWTDVGCFGSSLHQTPHVDSLARDGVRFTNAYSPACSCSPSRAGIMTGKFPSRLGMTAIVEKHRGDLAPEDAPLLPATTKPALPDQEVTIAEVLKAAGYATGLAGKWHLGDWKHDPKQHGFDVAIAPPHAGAPKSYFWPDWKGNPQMPGRRRGEYLTDRLAEEACRFVQQHQQEPFFLYLPLHSVHVPIEAKQDKVEKYRKLLRAKADQSPGHANPHYAAMVESMDEAVGRVLDTLRELQLEEKTMVIFFSDNGGLVHRSHRGDHTPATSNHPLRSGKGFLYEGGIRVPLIIRWPGVAKSGEVCEAPVHGCDLFPTICQAAGIDVDSLDYSQQLDGNSLQTPLRDPDQAMPERSLFWHYPHFSTMGGRPSAAIRSGHWKLLEHFETGQRELFDLANDIGETNDLSAEHPDQVNRLQRLLANWHAQTKTLLPSRPNPNYKGVKRGQDGQDPFFHLRNVFRDPPAEAKPRGYWVWPHGNFDYSTIRRELEAFQAKGLGGIDIFDLGITDKKDVIPPGPGFMSVEQVDGLAFAFSEAKRLGLKLGLIVSSSWNAGGSWTKPQHASMNLVAWKETVTGPVHYERVLPFPELPEMFSKSYGTYALDLLKNEQGLPQYYKDVAVLAYPLGSGEGSTDPKQVRILTDQVDAGGKLICDLPAGRWVIMRTVLTNFGQPLWHPSDNSRGLSIDHFSREATRTHFRTIVDRLEARVGPLEDTALERLYLASYENKTEVIWTPGFEHEFQQRNGYAIEPFIPALFGATVADAETTERFLYDFRNTASEMFLDNLYREASRICREHGLLLCSESGGPGAPLHDVPTEDLKALGAVDVMRGEFWVDKADRLDDDGLEVLQVVKQIASAAHIYGHRIVEMEAFTSHESWREGPDVFKRLADRAFCEGMTRVVYHTMSHNLPEAGKPGWTYIAGSHMNTNLTWWEMSDQLHAYLARSSALLMQGDFVADVAYYCGHEVPNFAKPKHVRLGLGRGYDYDDLNTEMLLKASVDHEGQIVLPGGIRYPILVLPHEDRMDLAVLKHIELLLLQGATVIGNKPVRTYGLRGHPQEQLQLRELADHIWSAEPTSQSYEKKYGRGRLVVGRSERQVLSELGISPDLQVHPTAAGPHVDFIHRRTSGQDIYFVRNSEDHEINIEVSFRVRRNRAELWNPADAAMIAPAIYQETDAGMRLPLHLPARGSVFVVFSPDDSVRPHISTVHDQQTHGLKARFDSGGDIRVQADKPGRYQLELSNGQTRIVTLAADNPPLEIEGPWEVRFPFGWDVPTRQVFDSLHSWTESEDGATRSFSGIATYAKQFDVDRSMIPRDGRVVLDLGQVRELARVYLNGNEVGISSFAPHVLDVTDVIRAGENSLVIEVANTWLNRLIADDSLPENERSTHTNLTRGPTTGTPWRDAQPKPSGLLGPVRLRFPKEAVVDLR